MSDALSAASVIPQLSIGVVAVLAFAVSIYFFIRHLERCNVAGAKEREFSAAAAERERTAAAEERDRYLAQIEDHHQALRTFEKDIRDNVMSTLADTTAQMKENTHLMTRVIDFLDQPSLRKTHR